MVLINGEIYLSLEVAPERQRSVNPPGPFVVPVACSVHWLQLVKRKVLCKWISIACVSDALKSVSWGAA